ncbi:MAG: DEAD/DEAH box helicase [Verrucomicrobiota bacterium]
MSTRSSSRVYNQAALETWFDNVAVNWENFFSEEALRKGRAFYREGLISGLELADSDAIVHCSFSRKDTCYSVIEWTSDGPSVRFSTPDIELGQAVAAGGLYEIEELIADEISPLPYVPKKKPKPDIDAKPTASEPEVLSAVVARHQIPDRELVPRLEGLRSGLRLTAFWQDQSGGRLSAFGSDEVALKEDERESLVKLTGRAKEAGFVFRRDANDFLLSDPERIDPFFSHTRKRWESLFNGIELDYDAQQMAEGVRAIKLSGEVVAAGKANMQVDWSLRLGRTWLEPEDAERLAKAGRGTHIVKGLGLVRIGEDESAALAEWRVSSAFNGKLGKEWPRYMVFSLFGERGAKLDLTEELTQWRAAIGENSETSDSVELPGFLRDYQAHGVRWMANLKSHACHGLLADEMGLGKTLQILTLLHHFPVESKNSLIVCPASVVPVWESEARRWYPEMKTSTLRTGQTFQNNTDSEPRIWIASYTQLRRHKHLLEDASFGYAVLDEAQQIKNPDAKVTLACCAIKADCRIALTGTPLENRMLDLWTIFRFLMPGLLGSRRRFEDCVENASNEAKEIFERRLRSQIAPFILRRRKDKVGKELPPKVEMDLVCPITDLQRQTYENLLTTGASRFGNDLDAAMRSDAMNFFSLLTRLRQVCCDPGLIPDVNGDIQQSGKVQTLLNCLSDAFDGNENRKIVVFSQFVQLLKRLKPLLRETFPKLAIHELTGETKDRAKPVDAFQDTEGQAMILVSLRAGGTGITLHAADYVFLLDPWWNPAVEAQAVDRVHRIGQQKRVFVYRMITQGTIEERIQQLKREKRELFENALGSLGGAADLKEHFGDLQELAKLIPVSKRAG